MPESYTIIENRIAKAIDALNSRKNAKLSAIAREFNVPRGRLRSRVKGVSSKTKVRGLHNRRIKPDQELALRLYLLKLDSLDIPARLHMVEVAAYSILRQTASDSTPPPPLGSHWIKRWLKRQSDLYKVKRKPLAAERKNAHDLKLLIGHFEKNQEVVNKYGINPKDQWNFDETGFRIGMARSDWIITADSARQSYSSDPSNRESLTAVECINGVGQDIPPFLIVSSINILAPWVKNDLSNDVVISTAESGCTNDWLSLQWIKHFDKHTEKIREGAWRLLIMDGYRSHHTREFLEYCETKNIIPFGLPSHTTHLLQPLDVCVFQPLKHWHSEAVNEAIQNGDQTFSKVEFLNAFSKFRSLAFKPSTIQSAWRKTGLIPFNPGIVLDKVRELLPPPPRESTPSHTAPLSVQETPRTVRQLATVATEIMTHSACSDDLVQIVSKFVKGAVAEVRKGDLLEQRWEQQIKAQTAWKARKREANKILHHGGVLTVGEARSMVRGREEQEEIREKERNVAWEKRYCTALTKVVRQSKAHRKMLITRSMNSHKRWMMIMKELLKTPRCM